MKLLMSSHCFHPSVGGLETVSQLLAEEFVRSGVELRLVTQTPSDIPDGWPFEVIRKPSLRQLWNLVRWSDVYFQNNISLQALWPLLALRRPWVVAHHIWIERSSGRVAWQDRLKRCLLRFGTSISISEAIARDLPVKSAVVGNPFSESEFRILPNVRRDRDLIFLGRLVSAKGVDLLIEALAKLKNRGKYPTLTIIGRGPEEEALRTMVRALDLEAQVEFAGLVRGADLVQQLNSHRIMVIPSRWAEPFGIVALEGIACGCAVVGSAHGGLSEAIGACGLTFPNGDVEALSNVLSSILDEPVSLRTYQEPATEHLRRFRPAAVAEAYLSIIRGTLKAN